MVEKGKKLPTSLSASSLATACHADGDSRIYGIVTFVEYAKEGGEPQASAVGYGGIGVTGVNARTDTFTMDKFYEGLNASLLKGMNKPYDVYFFDAKNFIYGINDGTVQV